MKTYHIRIDGQVYQVSVANLNTNPIQVTVDGETIEVWLEDDPVNRTDPARRAAHNSAPSGAQKSQAGTAKIPNGTDRMVKAPIPGVITAVQVRTGQVVQTGDVLCSLEAMKMVNAIRATRSGTIGIVHVSLGQHVRYQEVLMEYAEQES